MLAGGGGGGLQFTFAVVALAMLVPHVWHFLHANLSNRFSSGLFLLGLAARCHGIGRKGGRGGFSPFQLGYACGLSALLVLLVVKWPELSIKRTLLLGNIPSLLQAMDTYSWHVGHSLHACDGLARFVNASVANSERVASAGGITRLLNAMETHRASAQIQAEACLALGVLADVDYTNKARIIEGKGIIRVIDAMSDNEHDPRVQEMACMLLTSLAIGDDDNRADIVKAGAIPRILHAMRSHPLHGGVQTQASAALRSLAANDRYKTEIVDSGGIPLIVKAMDLHMDAGPLIEQACWAVRNLAGIDATRPKLAEAGLIERIIGDVMDVHRQDAGVIAQAAGALHNLALNSDDNKHRIAAVGGITRLVHALDAHVQSSVVQDNASWALMVMAWSQRTLRRQLRDAGVVERVEKILVDPTAAEGTKERVRTLLSKLKEA